MSEFFTEKEKEEFVAGAKVVREAIKRSGKGFWSRVKEKARKSDTLMGIKADAKKVFKKGGSK